jgi:hypothetical protein
MRDGANDDRDRSHFSPGASHEASTADSEPANGITVADAQLLFHTDSERAGDELRLIGSDREMRVVSSHFKSEHPAAMSPDGAAPRRDIAAAPAGPADSAKYAALDAPQPAMQVIGHAARIEGHVLVVRNGVAVTLNGGDVLVKGDAIQTDGDGVAGLVFNDGSAFQTFHGSWIRSNG